jgi:GntR family phosphonate transport system transcriptional regulator
MTSTKSTERSGGVALWRRVADDIRLDIAGGKYIDGGRLPAESALAERFGVNRHTVRRALVVLQDEGVVRTEQGRGTFVQMANILSYRIGRRTRFSEGLAGHAGRPQLLDQRIEAAPPAVARALGISVGARAVRMESLRFADGRPVCRATTWLAYKLVVGDEGV